MLRRPRRDENPRLARLSTGRNGCGPTSLAGLDHRGRRHSESDGLCDGRRAAGAGRPLHRVRADRHLRVLGSSRVLSVSTTTTIAILTGAARARGARRRSRQLLARGGYARADGRRRARSLARPSCGSGFLANFISEPVLAGFKAGIGVVIVLDQVPKLLGVHFPKGTFLQNLARVVPEPARAPRCRRSRSRSRCCQCCIGARAVRAARARAARDRGRGYRRDRRCSGSSAYGVETVGEIPRGLPRSRCPTSALVGAAVAGRARHRVDELHRDDGRGARVRTERRAAAAPEPGAARYRFRHGRRRAARRHARGRRHVADGGEPPRRRAQPARGAGHGGASRC